MKKKVFMMTSALILMIVGLGSCGNDNNITEIPETPEEQQEPKKEDPTPGKPDIPDEDSVVVDMLPQTRAIQLTPEQRAFAKKNNDFTFNLYRTIHQMQEVKKNFFGGSLKSMLSYFVSEENLSPDEIKELLEMTQESK